MPDDPFAKLADLRRELAEVQEGLELQFLGAEASEDQERARQVHATRSHLQAAEALVDQVEEAILALNEGER